jgi:hypothetical protein
MIATQTPTSIAGSMNQRIERGSCGESGEQKKQRNKRQSPNRRDRRVIVGVVMRGKNVGYATKVFD